MGSAYHGAGCKYVCIAGCVIKMWLFGKKKKVPEKAIVSDAEVSMSHFLLGYGFQPEEAMQESRKFWTKHRDKIAEVI